jgi:hypothetical protein
MTIHVSPDGSDWTKIHHQRNAASCKKLLELLYQHHGDVAPRALPAPVTVKVIAIEPKPDPVIEVKPEPVEIAPQAIKPEQPIVYGHTHYIHIQRVVAKHFGVSRLDLVGQSRRKKYSIPRQVAMYLIHDGKRTLPEIGRRFGGRDHTTVLHAVRKIERWVEQDLYDMRATVVALREALSQ